ncbi:DCL family protein [Streptomyces chartreusis]
MPRSSPVCRTCPSGDGFKYTSEALTRLTAGLLDQPDVTAYALYVQDYGAPIGRRLALANTAAMSAITCQSGNGHEVGFAEGFWKPVGARWVVQSSETEKALMLEATRSPGPTCSAAVVTDPDDDAFLRALLALHSEAEEKIGPGVDHFQVRKHPDWDTYGFWVVRTDGTEDDFSYPDIIRKL